MNKNDYFLLLPKQNLSKKRNFLITFCLYIIKASSTNKIVLYTRVLYTKLKCGNCGKLSCLFVWWDRYSIYLVTLHEYN